MDSPSGEPWRGDVETCLAMACSFAEAARPANATHWSVRMMAQEMGISHTSVQRIWNAHGLKRVPTHSYASHGEIGQDLFYAVAFEKMDLAVAVHMKGFGWAFQ